jgi:hypothetical protein
MAASECDEKAFGFGQKACKDFAASPEAFESIRTNGRGQLTINGELITKILY